MSSLSLSVSCGHRRHRRPHGCRWWLSLCQPFQVFLLCCTFLLFLLPKVVVVVKEDGSNIGNNWSMILVATAATTPTVAWQSRIPQLYQQRQETQYKQQQQYRSNLFPRLFVTTTKTFRPTTTLSSSSSSSSSSSVLRALDMGKTPTTTDSSSSFASSMSSSSSSSSSASTTSLLSRRNIMEQALTTSASSWTVVTASGLCLPTAATAAVEATTPTSTPNTIIVPQIQLGGNKGTLQVSRTIQGYWQLAGGHGRYKESDALANMKAHYDAGITALDTADIYGPSERVVGQFVAGTTSNNPGGSTKGFLSSPATTSTSSTPSSVPPVPCTKFCCFRFLQDIDRTEVKQRIQQQCERLQVSQLPLVQYFWSDYDIKRYVDVGLYLTELKEEGLIQEIGATNFDLPRLRELCNAGVPIVSHQVQLSALDRRPIQSGMSEWCVENGVSLIAFGTIASGILSQQYLGRRNEPLTNEESRVTASMRLYTATAKRFGPWSLVQELLETMQLVANQVQDDGRCPTATIANVAQRYVLQTPAVACVLIGVRNQDHIKENVATHAFSLTDNEMAAIDKIVAKRSGPKGDVWQIERGMM